MQYYTTQQLQGHSTFKAHVRIGNWNEDIELMNEKQREMQKAKELGLLPHQVLERKMQHHMDPVAIDINEEKYIRFGDIVMIKSLNTNGFLSMDLDTQLHHVHDRFACSTSPAMNSPVTRNCFIVERVENDVNIDTIIPEEENLFLHYGQKFRLKCLPQFSVPLFLRSEKASPTCFASGTSSAEKCQEVAVDQLFTYDSVWKLQFIHKGFRLENEGQLVSLDDPLLITHCATNQCLNSTKKTTVLNDFGQEYQVYCKTMFTIHKTEDVCNHFLLTQQGGK